MKKITITINTTNDAFAEDMDREVARILRDTARRVERSGADNITKVLDLNGNSVGTFEVEL